jgi:uncharacterized zinc-type alcohol dehydrogenase-like protein
VREAVLWTDTGAKKRVANSYDLMITTVPKSFPMQPSMDLLKLDAALVNAGEWRRAAAARALRVL